MNYLAGFWRHQPIQILWLIMSLLLLVGCNQTVSFSRPAGDSRISGATFVLPTQAPTAAPSPVNTRVLPVDSLTPQPSPTMTPIPDEVLGFVVQVLSGDTIAVVLEGDPPALAYEVRYIGVDAPPNAPNDPWGVVAYETNRKMTSLKIVRLVRDEIEQDEEGRLLRHVYVDNQLMSIVLAEQGLVRLASSAAGTQFEADIEAAVAQARSEAIGVWGNARPTPTTSRRAAEDEAEVEATDEPGKSQTEVAEPESTDEPDTTLTASPGDETTTPSATEDSTETATTEATATDDEEAAEPSLTPTPSATATVEATSEPDDR